MEAYGRNAGGPRGVPKRARQACSNCRRRKTKCSGERPICAHCRQGRLGCVYEPYTTTSAATTMSIERLDTAYPPSSRPNHGMDLLQRISSIESTLQNLTRGRLEREGRALEPLQTPSLPSPRTEDGPLPLCLDTEPVNDAELSEPGTLSAGNSSVSPNYLPPAEVVESLVNTYFSHIHNQPYSFFHPGAFRQRLSRDSLPKCLLYAVLAMAVRFTDHPHFHGGVKVHEASASYSRRSWLHVIEDYLSVDDNLDLAVIQTVTLLSLVDYTAGRASSGWLRLGLAVRLSQDFGLMEEPPCFLSSVENEERRRCFWSIYIVDKLMSCSRSRPPAVLDEGCTLQLPCDEETFQKGEWARTPTLEQMQSWQSAQTTSASSFGLAVLASSIFGRCVRYVYGRHGSEIVPPWDSKSDYIATNALLLLLESLMDTAHDAGQGPSAAGHRSLDADGAGYRTFSRALFHAAHCLLNHPFLMRLRLRPMATRTPESFVDHAFHLARKHATHLTDLLTGTSDGPPYVRSSAYSFCATVAAGIHFLTRAAERHGVRVADNSYDAETNCTKSMRVLERLAERWPFAVRMKSKLVELESQIDELVGLVDPRCPGADGLRPDSEQFLWSLLDLGSLTKDGTGSTPASFSFLEGLPSPGNWELLTDQNSMSAPSGPEYDLMMGQLGFPD